MPSGPSALARLTAFLRRHATLLAGAGVCTGVAVVVLAVLVVTGGGAPADDTVTVDASTDLDRGGAELESGTVRLGVDGEPGSATPPPPEATAPGTPPGSTAPGATAPDSTAPGSTTAGSTAPGATAGAPGSTSPGSTAPGTAGGGGTTPGSSAPGTPSAGPAPSGGAGPSAGGSPSGSSTPAIPDAPGAPVAVDAPAPGPTPAGAPAPAGPVEQQVLALVNRERAAAGCGAVVADPGLATVARAHSADMRDRGFFDHTNPDGRDPFDRAAAAGVSARAENIARGQADAAAVMTAWMGSPGHRANILDCGLTRLGVGVAEGAGGPWWTQLFG